MRILTLIFCLVSVASFAQEDTSKIIQDLSPKIISLDSTLIPKMATMDGVWLGDCAHGHICCEVGCGCCQELNRMQIYDTIYSPVRNGVRRITVVERYQYALSTDLQPVHYRFKGTGGKWSEKYYPVHIYEGIDYERIDKKFGQYPNQTETKYVKENQVLVYTAEGEYMLINLEGKQVPFKCHSSVKLEADLYLASVIVAHKQLFGFTNAAGVQISKLKYSVVLPFNKEGFAKVCDQAGRSGLVDKTGKEVIPCVYSYLDEIGKDRYHASINSYDVYCIINSAGETITTKSYKHFGKYSEGLVSARREDMKLVYLDMNGKEVIQCDAEWGREFHDGLAGVLQYEGEGGQRKPLWGFIDTTGELVIDYQFYKTHDFQDGAAPVCTGTTNPETWKVINKKGKVISPQTYTNMEPFRNGIAPIIIGGEGCGLINTNGKELMPCAFASFDRVMDDSWELDGRIIRFDWRKDSTLEMVDRYGKQILDLRNYKYADFTETYYQSHTVYPFIRVVKYNQLTNLIDYNGKELLADDYSVLTLFPGNVVVGEKAGKQFLISLESGKVIKDFGELKVANIVNGIVSVTKENDYYNYEYYDLSGKKLEEY